MQKRLMKTLFSFLILGIAVISASGVSYAQRTVDEAVKKPALPANYKFQPKQVRWGCLVCHSDKSLSRLDEKSRSEKSLYIDENIIGSSVHKNIACLDCHENFSYSGHPKRVPEHFRRVAGLACKKCHPYQYQRYQQSYHGELEAKKSRKKTAICADCHGSHNIQKITTPEGNAAFRAKSRWVCSRCHTKRTVSYNDYYHGAAYRRGEPDAPACWDCHDNHGIKRAKDPKSTVHKANLPNTCAKCHTDTSEAFTDYAQMMHGRNKILANNFISRIYYSIFPEKKQTVVEVARPVVDVNVPRVEESKSLLTRIIGIFFPDSLRPRKDSE